MKSATQGRIGFSKTTLLASSSIELCGYGYYRKRYTTGVLNPIYTKALYIELNNQKILLISNDLLGLPPKSADTIISTISAQTGISPQYIFISCTHTHSGPTTIPLEGCGIYDSAYVSSVEKIIVENALSSIVSSELLTDVSKQVLKLNDFVFDKSSPTKDIVSQDVFFLKFHGQHKTFLLVNFACHPIVLNYLNTKLSTDYVQAFYNLSDYSLADEVIFFNGASAELLPAFIKTAKNNGESTSDSALNEEEYLQFINETSRKLMDLSKNEAWVYLDSPSIFASKHLVDIKFDVPLEMFSRDEIQKYYRDCYYNITSEIQAFINNRTSVILDSYSKGLLPKTISINLGIIKIDSLVFVTVPAEISHKLTEELKTFNPNIYVFSHTDSIVGYITSSVDNGYSRKRGALLYNYFPFEKGTISLLVKKLLVELAEGSLNDSSC